MIITTRKRLRPRDPHDHYPTPLDVCRAALAVAPPVIDIGRPPFTRAEIVDAGAGSGNWGIAARERYPTAAITGIELRNIPRNTVYDAWVAPFDYLSLDIEPGIADLIVGNPPYALAESFVRKSLSLVKRGGHIVFLLKLSFLASRGRGAGLYRSDPPQFVHVMSARPSFILTGEARGRTDDTEYAIYVWRNGWTGSTTLKWLDWKEPPANQQLPLI